RVYDGRDIADADQRAGPDRVLEDLLAVEPGGLGRTETAPQPGRGASEPGALELRWQAGPQFLLVAADDRWPGLALPPGVQVGQMVRAGQVLVLEAARRHLGGVTLEDVGEDPGGLPVARVDLQRVPRRWRGGVSGPFVLYPLGALK